MSLPFRKVRRPDWPLGQFLPGNLPALFLPSSQASLLSWKGRSASIALGEKMKSARLGTSKSSCFARVYYRAAVAALVLLLAWPLLGRGQNRIPVFIPAGTWAYASRAARIAMAACTIWGPEWATTFRTTLA